MSDKKEVPGGVYLCQVSENVSCAACCGLYNVQNGYMNALEESLMRRTERFHGVARDMESILAFKEHVVSEERQSRPFPDFHHCPYLGLIGKQRSRVGCLLHPFAERNDGLDWRGLSFYGGMACRVYFCSSCHVLPSIYKAIVAQTAPQWHLYGLVVTETEMLNNFFLTLESYIQRPLNIEDIRANEMAAKWLWRFCSFKIQWPFRPDSVGIWGNYSFHDARNTHPDIKYDHIGATGSKYDAILRAFRSEFQSLEELKEAETLLDEVIENLAKCLSFGH